MAKYFISKLQIEGFRGINNENDPLEINLKSDQVNSIFASNAQGKSSIFDALSFAIKGTVPKLANLQQSERAENYYINQFHSGAFATILLTFQPDDGSPAVVIRVKRLANGTRAVDSPSGFATPEQLLASLNSEFCLLDYRSFLGFVEETPLKRGRAFSSLLGLGKLSAYRQALEVLSNTRNVNSDFEIPVLEQQISDFSNRKGRAESQIRALYLKLTNLQIASLNDYGVIVNESTTALRSIPILTNLFESNSILNVDFSAVKSIIRDAERGADQDRLRQIGLILNQINPIDVDSQETNEREILKDMITTLKDDFSKTKGSLTKAHYEASLKLMSSEEWRDDKACPTCESALVYSLPDALKKKLEQFKTVDESHSKLKRNWYDSRIRMKLNQLATSTHLVLDPVDLKRAKELAGFISTAAISSENLDELIAIRMKFDATRQQAISLLEGEKEKLQKELPPSLVALTEQVGVAEDLKREIENHSRLTQELFKTEKKLAARNRWVAFISNASQVFAQAEVALSTAKTLRLETSYRNIYQEITNNPDVVPKLVKTVASEDLHLNLERFYGKHDLAASALLSESYRNALALSIFLSAAIENSTSAFIVFDDVTSSFDAGHQFSLMEVLRTKIARPNNATGPQVIVLSHDGLLEKYFDKISSTAPWHHQRLHGLSPNGSIFTQTQSANRLKFRATQFLQAGQIDQAEPLVRQYLEFKLLEIIQRVSIPVPVDFSIRDDRKMVQNCINAITSAIDLYSGASRLILTNQQQADVTNTLIPTIVANWLSHYSTAAGSSFSPHVLLGVLNSIDQVADCFMYNCICSGSSQRRYYKSLSTKHCACV
ncbi:MAG: DUF2813 domain-containing protein [Bacteroidota bacterium]